MPLSRLAYHYSSCELNEYLSTYFCSSWQKMDTVILFQRSFWLHQATGMWFKSSRFACASSQARVLEFCSWHGSFKTWRPSRSVLSWASVKSYGFRVSTQPCAPTQWFITTQDFSSWQAVNIAFLPHCSSCTIKSTHSTSSRTKAWRTRFQCC